MTPALLITAYAVAVAWWSPILLAPLTSAGVSTRLGLTAWLTAMASVLACLVVALQQVVSAAVAGWSVFAEAICQSVAGHACSPVVYRSAVLEIPLAAAAAGGALTTAVLAWGYARRVQRAQRQTRAHADTARIAGRRVTTVCGALVLEASQAAAYCVPGRPAAIVLTSGALALLDPEQVTAVIEHEKAHLAGSHHVLIALTRGLAATFPAVPLFSRGAAEVARLAEMRADDAAARASGSRVLVTALLAMGTGVAIPAAALAATGGDIAVRIQRLLEPPARGQHARNWLALITVILLLVVASCLLPLLAQPIAAYALH